MEAARRAEQFAARYALSELGDDPRFLLSVITERGRLFRDKLSRAEQSFAPELRDTGNKLAHGAAFGADDTYRALDTMERLLAATDAHEQADEVRKLRRDAQQAGVQVRDQAGRAGRSPGWRAPGSSRGAR